MINKVQTCLVGHLLVKTLLIKYIISYFTSIARKANLYTINIQHLCI